MKHYRSKILILLALGFDATAFSPQDQPDPRILLNEMSEASHGLSYDGIFIYRRGKQIDTMRIIHKSVEEGVYERLVSLTGHAREMIRDQEKVKCYFPDDKVVVVEKSRLGKWISAYLLPRPIQSVSEFYNFELMGQDRIADKDAWIINVKPNDKYRYGYQLWIDKDSRLLLKSELKNQSGVTLEQMMFTQLSVLAHIDDELLEPSVSADDYTWYNNINFKRAASDDEGRQWQATWMPTGFTMSKYAKQAMTIGQASVDHLVYTDGLAMVSIFVEGTESAEQTAGPSKVGGVNAYTVYSDGYQITVVGEVPEVTVKQMADSVKPSH